MKKFLILFICLSCILIVSQAQPLTAFSVTMKTDSISYLSLTDKKIYRSNEAMANKQFIDFALIPFYDKISPRLEWYNMSGKDDKIPAAMTGTATKINAISFDREQFDKCKTHTDLQRMAGYITPSSFSHFAVIGYTKEINQHCFILERETGKRGLLYVTVVENGTIKVEIKMQ